MYTSYTSPIFGQACQTACPTQNPMVQQQVQQTINMCQQVAMQCQQIALQQCQSPNPMYIHQVACQIEQQKQVCKQMIHQLVQQKLAMCNMVQNPIQRQQVEQSVQRLVQLAQIKHQIRQLVNQCKNQCNPQQIHDNMKQVLELTQLVQLVCQQIRQNQYSNINFGSWAQTGMFNTNPFQSAWTQCQTPYTNYTATGLNTLNCGSPIFGLNCQY
jgi:leucyl aminopeptidase